MLLAKLYAMPLRKSGLALGLGKGIGSPGLTSAASKDLHTSHVLLQVVQQDQQERVNNGAFIDSIGILLWLLLGHYDNVGSSQCRQSTTLQP